MEISIVVPVYNEEDTLENCIEKVTNAASKVTDSFEILIAEDGSKDATYGIAKKLSKMDSRVKVIHHGERLGRGGALKNAFRKARGKVLVYMDADLSSDLNYLGPLVERVKDGASIATGSRLMKGASAERPFQRDISSRVYNFMVRLFLNSKIYDHQCGMKAFNRKTVLPLLRKVKDDYWFWDTEILVRAQKEGLRVDEIPIRWAHGRSTKVSFTKDVLYMGRKIFELRSELSK
jgi:hypothetical protein